MADMPFNDPTRITTGVAAVMGGLVWSMRHILKTAMAPTLDESPESRRIQRRAYLEAAFCTFSAGIGGFFVAPALLKYYHVTSIETCSAVGCVFGLGFWSMVPILSQIGPAVAQVVKSMTVTYAKRLVGASDTKDKPE